MDPNKNYKVNEINVMPGRRRSFFYVNGKVYSGDYLMKVGLNIMSGRDLSSSVYELTEQK